ncbi:8257_t:CDS:2 [Paraglomus brasilianum]|uniref:8257_t:CDS:1 n=1 Tax=Paraglomus brasilianum TaxID=144538 RepID=A0A9N8VXG5_9GLOM|nr:8257_t:CDS:2 [Paraglomus brasilianum]
MSISFGRSTIGRPYIIGHRGASARYPENTVLSIEQAIAEGADGIEFDIQKTADNQIIVHHDEVLDRTTTGSGRISSIPYYGVIEHLTTKSHPQCSIPRLDDVINVMMRPENCHVFAVIDIKPNNDPTIIALLADILKKYSDDVSIFKSRLSLGIRHPLFLPYCHSHLNQIPIMHIGSSLDIAQTYFPNVAGYNLTHVALSGSYGRSFIDNAHANGQSILAWVVNYNCLYGDCRRWGVDGVITDKTKDFVNMYGENGKWDENENILNWIMRMMRGWLYAIGRVAVHQVVTRRLKKCGELKKVD